MFVSVGSFWVTSSEPKCGIGANCKPTWTQNKIKIVLIQKQIKHHFRNRSSLGLPMLGKLWKSSNIFFVSTPVRLHVSSLREKHVRNFGGAPTCEVLVVAWVGCHKDYSKRLCWGVYCNVQSTSVTQRRLLCGQQSKCGQASCLSLTDGSTNISE